jgi:hypothetical protein
MSPGRLGDGRRRVIRGRHGAGTAGQGQVALPGRAGDPHDRPHPAGPQQLHVQQAGHAEADHDGAGLRGHRHPGQRVDAGGQHLDQGRLVGGDPGGQRVQQGFRYRHVLGEAAVEVTAEQSAPGTQVRQVAAALPAQAAERGRVDHDRGTSGHGSPGTGALHPPGHLVPEHPGRGDRERAGGELAVGAADAGHAHPDQGQPAGLRHRDLPYRHGPGPLDDRCQHGAMLSPHPTGRRRQ